MAEKRETPWRVMALMGDPSIRSKQSVYIPDSPKPVRQIGPRT
jgi:hypothetical protein